MKKVNSLTVVLRVVCGLLITLASQSTHAGDGRSTHRTDTIVESSAANGARIIIKRSPILAFDITMTVTIDGRVAGTSVYGHTYDQAIAPGRHLLVASPNRLRGDWSSFVDMRPGETYVYLARYHVNTLVLDLENVYR